MKKTALFALCISAAAALSWGCAKTSVQERPAEPSDIRKTSLNYDSKSRKVFSELKLEEGRFTVDGKLSEQSCGGFTVLENGTVMVSVDGEELTFEEAEKKIGCTMTENSDGSISITSPFQTAGVIVKCHGDFEKYGAVSAVENIPDHYLLKYNSPSEAYSAYLKFLSDENIEYAEPDRVMHTEGFDDTKRIESWGLSQIGAVDFCQKIDKKDAELPQINVAVVDTGIYHEHSVFENRILENGRNYVTSEDENKKTDINNTSDDNGHGSHCAGIICSATNDNVKILPVKVLNEDGYGYTYDIYCGMMYAAEQNVDIMSISLGGYGKSNLFDEAVSEIRKKDIVVCVAAGNEAAGSEDNYSSLAANPDCVVVASLNESRFTSDFSNYQNIDFAAPGEHIRSVSIDGPDETVAYSGTSMATPFVAACFADLYSYNDKLTSDEAYDMIKANAVDIYDPGYDDETGWGEVNLYNFHFDTEMSVSAFASVKGGSYFKAIDVKFSSNYENAKIYYTLNGTEATPETGILYDGKPVHIDESTTLRFVAVIGDIVSVEKRERYDLLVPYDKEYLNEVFVVKNGELSEVNLYNLTKGQLYELEQMETLDLREMAAKKLIPEFTKVSGEAFSGVDMVLGSGSFKTIILPDSVSEISDYAFYKCGFIEKLVTNAEFIGKKAFYGCYNLKEIDDNNIRQIGENAFYSCSDLYDADFKKLTEIPSKAFLECASIRRNSFSLNNITKFGESCFEDSGLNGIISLNSAETIKKAAFKNCMIEEVTLPENITSLSDEVFFGCKKLRKISAPFLNEIGAFSLALMKDYYTSENEVETDIDFSKIKSISDEYPLLGYVFDKPVSFDSLPEGPVDSFYGVSAESVSLPNFKKIYSLYDEKSKNFEYNTALSMNMLILENAETFESHALLNANAVITGSNVKSVEKDSVLGSGCFYSSDDNADVLSLFEKSGVKYQKKSEACVGKINNDYEIFEKASAYAVCPDGSLSFRWTVINADTEKIVSTYENSKYPAKIYTYSDGDYIYRLEIIDSDGNIKETREYKTNIFDYYTEGEVYENELITELGKSYYDFHPKETGEYQINAWESQVIIYGDDCSEMTFNNETAYVTLSSDVNYKISVKYIKNWTSSDFLECASINSPGNYKQHLSSVLSESGIKIEYDKSVSDLPVIKFFKPDGTLLKEGEDYTLECYLASENMFLYNTYGMGDYYGIYVGPSIYSKENTIEYVPLNKEYTLETSSVFFAPEKSGYYNIIIKPNQKLLSEYEANGEIPADFRSSFSGVLIEDSETDEIIDKAFADKEVFGSFCFQSLYLEPGKKIEILHNRNDNSIVMVTDKPLINQCSIDMTLNYKYTGEKIKPEVKISYMDKLLEEGKDYTVRAFNNIEPGPMFAVIDGCGDFEGTLTVPLTIKGENLTARKYDGRTVFEINPDEKFTAYGLVPYLVTFDKDTEIKYNNGGNAFETQLTFINADKSVPTEPIRVISNTNEIIPKGTYIFYYCYKGENDKPFIKKSEGVSIDILNAEKININEVNPVVKYEKSGTPDISLKYADALLKEGDDYTTDSADSESAGMYTASVSGINNYCREKKFKYLVLPENNNAEHRTLSDGVNSINISECCRYEWIPEKANYYIESGVLDNTAVCITDEDGNMIFCDEVNLKSYYSINVKPAEKYLVYVYSETCSETEIGFRTEGRMADCTVDYEKYTVFSDDKSMPDVTFRDGEYTLAKGKDYEVVNNGFINESGRREYIYRGCGKYFGEITVPVITYDEKLTDFTKFEDAELNKKYIADGDIGGKLYLKFTAEEEALYEINMEYVYTSCSEYNNLIVYDSEGRFTGCDDAVRYIKLGKGETIYIVMTTPCIIDDDNMYYSYDTLLYVNKSDYDTKPMTGDVNCDGKVNVFDLMRLKRYFTGSSELSAQGKLNAAACGDSDRKEPILSDMLSIMKMILADSE